MRDSARRDEANTGAKRVLTLITIGDLHLRCGVLGLENDDDVPMTTEDQTGVVISRG
jgi:hypothetical protein